MTDSAELLDDLIGGFLRESPSRYSIQAHGLEEKRSVLRSLMNIRYPVPASPELIGLQDRYLIARRDERGIVDEKDIDTIDVAFGSHSAHSDRIALWQGDITTLRCGAIVNAANSRMLGCFRPGHLCIDNCIHTYAGIQLRLECDRRMRDVGKGVKDFEWPTSVPMLTDSYNLPCDKVVHVVGPISSGTLNERLEDQLADCYSNTLDMCRDNGIRTVAFCCISTGVFGFPNRRAAEIAVDTVRRWLDVNGGYVDKVIFNVFLDRDRGIYEEILG